MKRFSAVYNLFRMFALIFKHKKLISACLMFLSFVYGILPTVSVYVMSLFLDHFSKGIWYVLPYFTIWVLLLLSIELLVYLKGILSLRVQYEIEEEYKILIMEKMLNIDLRYRENSEYADIIARAQNAINPINIMNLINNIPMLVSQIVGMLSILILFSGISWGLPILCVAFLTLCIFLQKYSSKAYFDFLRKNSKEDRLLSAHENMIIDANTLKELRIYNVIDWAVNKWKTTFSKVYRIKERKGLRKSIESNLSNFFMQDLLPVILIMAILLSPHFSVSSVIMVTQLSFTLSGKIFFVVYQMSAFHEIDQLLKDFFSFLDLDIVKIREKGDSAENLNICLENVDFKYDKEFVLKNINLNIHHGEKIAIVGANGSGKTTLAKILLGLYNPNSGIIKFESSNHVEYYRTSVMFQDYVQYYLTLRENIGFGDLDQLNHDALLKKIMKEANIDYLLDRIQLDDQIGRAYDGAEFSGGEWQKLAFARAIVNDEASLLVLDEPTSSIDSVTESQIIHRLMDLTVDTVIIISHKLSTVRLVDKIVVMKNGEIIESGTHEELMHNKANYYQMYLSQAKMYS